MNEIRKALELALSHKDDCKQDPETCDCFSARTYRAAKEALALLPPEGETRGDGSIEHPFVKQYIGKCFHREDNKGIPFDVGICERDDGYELTITGQSGVDEWYAIHPDGSITNLAEPAPSSEKAPQSNIILGLGLEYSTQPNKQEWRLDREQIEAIINEHLYCNRRLLASSPAPLELRIDKAIPPTEIRALQNGKEIGRIVNLEPPAPEDTKEHTYSTAHAHTDKGVRITITRDDGLSVTSSPWCSDDGSAEREAWELMRKKEERSATT